MMEVIWPLLRTLFCVIIVAVLAYFATKYVAGGRLGSLGAVRGAESLKIHAQLVLGRDQRLLVVQAGERYLLLGATPTQITNLAELTPEEAEAWTKKADISTEGRTTGFREALQNVTKQRRQR